MRDWSSAFRRASFRGVTFWVDEDGPDGGRRVAVHDISSGEAPVVEDMGRVAKRFTVSAYVVSDLADVEGLALERACDAIGAAVLRLPMDPFQMAHCEGCRRNRRKDRNGHIAYDLAFVEAGTVIFGLASPLSILRSILVEAMGLVAAAIALYVEVEFLIGWLEDLGDRFILDGDDAAVARRLILGIAQGEAAGAASFLNACRVIGEAADDPAGLIVALDGLSGAGVAQSAGSLVIRCFAAIRIDYAARPDAQAARMSLSSAAEPIYEVVGTAAGAEVLAFLVRLVGQSALAISAIAATRSPLVRVETGLSLPSSLLAYDLYGDPSRGRELVQRNQTGTPMVMPVALEALAS